MDFLKNLDATGRRLLAGPFVLMLFQFIRLWRSVISLRATVPALPDAATALAPLNSLGLRTLFCSALLLGFSARSASELHFCSSGSEPIPISEHPKSQLEELRLLGERPGNRNLMRRRLLSAAVRLGLALCCFAGRGRGSPPPEVCVASTLVLLLSHFGGDGGMRMAGAAVGDGDSLVVACLALLLLGEGPTVAFAMRMLLSAAHFLLGISKILRAPLGNGWGLRFWFSGRALQLILHERDTFFDLRAARVLASFPSLCALISTVATAFELCFVAVLFFPGLAPYFAVVGLCSHIGRYKIVGVNFVPYWLPAYVALLPDLTADAIMWEDGVGRGCVVLLSAFLFGVAARYLGLFSCGFTRKWPLGMIPFYSSFLSSFVKESDSKISMEVVSAQFDGNPWLPCVDSCLALCLNGEWQHRSRSADDCIRASLFLLRTDSGCTFTSEAAWSRLTFERRRLVLGERGLLEEEHLQTVAKLSAAEARKILSTPLIGAQPAPEALRRPAPKVGKED